jgi:hypothetical protein
MHGLASGKRIPVRISYQGRDPQIRDIIRPLVSNGCRTTNHGLSLHGSTLNHGIDLGILIPVIRHTNIDFQ